MENYPPNIEFLANNQGLPPYFQRKPWYRSLRFLVFISIFVTAVSVSLFYNYSRPAIYRSSATLLTSAMTAIDEQSSDVDLQNVAIQKQVLLGHELLTETLLRLNAVSAEPKHITLPEVQSLLTVEPVVDTNLVEVKAEGADAEFLPRLINTWIDVYFDARKEEVKKQTNNTTQIIEDELKGLAAKVNDKRNELETFRKENDILSSGRDENEALARLKGLTESLNKALEQEVKAKANVDAIKSAIADGQPIVPDQDQGILQTLEARRQQLKEKQQKTEKQFTPDYIKLQPGLKVIPEEIEKIEAEIISRLDYGKNIVRTEAEKDYASARQAVKAIRSQLDSHKKQAAEFTKQFTKHETLKTDLESLEKIYRESQERLVQIQANHKEKYPQVTVINRAFQPDKPISPDYHRDALIAAAGSLLLALFGVWMVDYIGKKQDLPTSVNLSNIHMYQPTAEYLDHQQVTSTGQLDHQSVKNLAGPLPRELSSFELKLLMQNANLKGKQLIACLLSGLSLAEAINLKSAQLDFDKNTITITDLSARTLNLNKVLKTLLAQSGGHPDWDANTTNISNELSSKVLGAALDSGLPHPEEITPDAIRHSYITFLVRQGLRLSNLEAVVGYLEPSMMLIYSAFSPAQQRGRNVMDVDLLHPTLADEGTE
ncbi:MAG: integrase [Methylococcales bacterium]